MSRYRLLQDAERDLTEIWNYGFQRFGEAQADKFFMSFFEHFQNLADAPFLYPAVKHIGGNYRRSVYQKHSVYYEIMNDVVEIKAIISRQAIASRLK